MSEREARYYPVPLDPIEPHKTIEVPSVTTITGCAAKYGLLYFYAKHGLKRVGNRSYPAAEDIAREASAIGTGVHDYILDRSKGKKPKVASKYARPVANYEKFRKVFKPKTLLADAMVYSLKHGYAGTLDEVAEIGDKQVLIDWKTSKELYPDYKMQVEAYYRAIIEMLTTDVTVALPAVHELWLVQLDKEKEFDEKKHVLKFEPNIERFKAFLGLRSYFYWNKQLNAA